MYRPERCALRRGRVDFSRWLKKPRRVNTCFPDDFTQKEALLMWNRRKEEELVSSWFRHRRDYPSFAKRGDSDVDASEPYP